VEPGTPRGFETIIAARDTLIAAGANIVAPCTHAGRCPLAGKDWCHFDTRLERTRVHQQVKSGSLPYEIEKYSYLIASRQRGAAACDAARVIRRPLKKSGHVILDLCTSLADAQRVVVSRRDRKSYRQARAAKWGDLWIAAENEVR
jgi:ribosomal protein RSM22 (predicted rRNA methylase)